MKRILGSLALIIVLWLGSTAVIGNKTKSELDRGIEKSNKEYAKHGIELNILEYEQSFFTSGLKLEVKILDKELEKMITDNYGLIFPLISQYDIEHGPLFFKNGLGVGLSRVYQELEISSLFRKEIQEKFSKKSMIASKSVVSFSKIADYSILSEAIEIKDENSKIDISPFEIRGETHLDTLVGETQIVLPLFSFLENEKKLMIESMQIDVKIDDSLSPSLAMGDIDLSIKKLYISDKENGEIELYPTLSIVSKKDSDKTFGSNIEMQIDVGKSTTQKSLAEIEKLFFNIKMDGIGIKGMEKYQTITKKMEQKQATIMIDIQKNPENQEENYAKLVKLQEEMSAGILDTLKDMIFKNKSAISYSFMGQTKDKKDSHGDISLKYIGDINFSKTAQEISQEINTNLFNLFELEIDINVDEKHISTLPDGDEFLKQLQAPMTQTMVNHQNQKYIIKGHLKNQELILNDNNLTNTVLPLLKMLTQMGMSK